LPEVAIEVGVFIFQELKGQATLAGDGNQEFTITGLASQ